MHITDILKARPGTPVDQFKCRVTKAYAVESGTNSLGPWSRMDMDVKDGTSNGHDLRVQWWNPAIEDPEAMTGRLLLINAVEYKGKLVGATVDEGKRGGKAYLRVKVSHLDSLTVLPEPDTHPAPPPRPQPPPPPPAVEPVVVPLNELGTPAADVPIPPAPVLHGRLTVEQALDQAEVIGRRLTETVFIANSIPLEAGPFASILNTILIALTQGRILPMPLPTPGDDV